MKIYIKGRNNLFFAEAKWSDKKVVVLKGSKINPKFQSGFRFTKSVINAREDNEVVDVDGILIKDIEFKSLTAAAQFITGRSVNGKRVWKDASGKTIIDIQRN